MPPVGMEPTNQTGEQPQTHASDRSAAGIGTPYIYVSVNNPAPFMCDTPSMFVQVKTCSSQKITRGPFKKYPDCFYFSDINGHPLTWRLQRVF